MFVCLEVYYWQQNGVGGGVELEGGKWPNGDKWVGDRAVNRLRGAGETVDEKLKVAQLLGADGDWDAEILQNLFSDFERDIIGGTKRRDGETPDMRWWTLESTGKFSVKSCYLAQKGFYSQHAHTSGEDCKFWRKLVWQVSIPPKVRVFMWRACKNVIPTMGNLREHHVPVDGICQICGDRWATTEHMLLYCPKIRTVWKESGFWRYLKEGRAAGFLEVAVFMEKELEGDEYAVWCIMVWKI